MICINKRLPLYVRGEGNECFKITPLELSYYSLLQLLLTDLQLNWCASLNDP
jgi:hypothetical protein